MAGYIGSKAAVVSSGVERKKTYAITTSTTSLTGLNYTVGKVHVFQNGVRLLDGTDYTATNGTSITLTVAAQSGDNVVVVSQASFQLSDHYTKTASDARYVQPTHTGNLDITGTVTSDGLTVDGNATISSAAGSLYLEDNNYTAGQKVFGVTSKSGDLFLRSFTDDKLTATNRFGIDHSTGDISFYEDTGTTAKFFWDASAESLGIGSTTAPSSSDVKQVISSSNGAFTQYSYNGGAGGVVGSADVGYLDFFTYTGNIGSETYARRMTIDSSGNVGIGDSNPLSILHVGTGASANVPITFAPSTGGNIEFRNTSSTGTFTITNGNGSSENLRIDSSGNVGISDTNPQSRLHIRSDNTSFVASNGAGIKGIQLGRSSGNSENLYMYTTSGGGWSGIAYVARLENYGNNVLEIGSQAASPISFGTNNTERMKIDGSGRVTMPYQPQVDVLLNGTRTSAGTFQTSSVYVDQGNNWNSSTHRFNAPVAARYRVTLSGYTNYTNSYGYYAIYKNGASTGVVHFNHQWGTGHSMFGYSRIIYLAAGDYIEAKRPNSVGSGYFDAMYITVELTG